MTARLTAAVFAGIIGGAIGFSALTVAWHAVFAPELLQDGLYFIVFIGTIPAGALIGGFTGAAIALRGDSRLSGAIAIAGGVAGFAAVAALIMFRIVGMRVPEDILAVWGHAVLWASALLLWGYRSLVSR